MAFSFKNYLFSLLPEYFKKRDNYKDANGEGLLERYLRIFGDEIDENMYSFIGDFLDIIYLGKQKDVCILTRPPNTLTSGSDILVYSPPQTIINDKFLKYIAYMLGNPIDINGMAETYRKIVNYAVAIYKVKGTIRSYELLFNLLGLSVTIRESPITKGNTYDQDTLLLYDTEGILYDIVCSTCSTYLIIYYDKEQLDCSHDQLSNLDPVLISNIKNIVQFLEPINVSLDGIVRGAYNFCENYTLAIDDQVTLSVIPPDTICGNPYDLSLEPYSG